MTLRAHGTVTSISSQKFECEPTVRSSCGTLHSVGEVRGTPLGAHVLHCSTLSSIYVAYFSALVFAVSNGYNPKLSGIISFFANGDRATEPQPQ
jgi:hypothetical protein